MGNVKINSFAYADDINLISATAPGLQSLIDICYNYANTWGFNFGHGKTKCMITGDRRGVSHPSTLDRFRWYLGNHKLDVVEELEILGVTYTSSCSYTSHANKQCAAARRSV